MLETSDIPTASYCWSVPQRCRRCPRKTAGANSQREESPALRDLNGWTPQTQSCHLSQGKHTTGFEGRKILIIDGLALSSMERLSWKTHWNQVHHVVMHQLKHRCPRGIGQDHEEETHHGQSAVLDLTEAHVVPLLPGRSIASASEDLWIPTTSYHPLSNRLVEL